MSDDWKLLKLHNQIIGALLNKPDFLPLAYPYLSKISFDDPLNKLLNEAIIFHYERDIPIDIVSIIEHLHKTNGISSNEVVDIYNLQQSTIDPGEKNLLYWLDIALEKSTDKVIQKVYNEKLSDGISAEQAMELAKESIEPMKLSTQTTLKDSVLEILKGERSEKILPTGIIAFDRALEGGLKTKQLIVIGGKTGIGKSLLTMSIATHIALSDHKIQVFCTEMSDYILARRYISANFNIPLSEVVPEKMKERHLVLPDALDNIIIDKTPSGTIERLIGQVKALHSQTPLALVVIDHIQRIENDRKNENMVDFLKRACSVLKNLAMRLDISVIAVSQFSREAARNKPELYNFRGSGGIEEEADVGILLDEAEKMDSPDKLLIVKIAKGRDIPKSTFGLMLEGEYGRFRDISASEEMKVKQYDLRGSKKAEIAGKSDYDDSPF